MVQMSPGNSFKIQSCCTYMNYMRGFQQFPCYSVFSELTTGTFWHLHFIICIFCTRVSQPCHWGWRTVGGSPVLCRISSSISTLYLLDARHTPLPLCPPVLTTKDDSRHCQMLLEKVGESPAIEDRGVLP